VSVNDDGFVFATTGRINARTAQNEGWRIVST